MIFKHFLFAQGVLRLKQFSAIGLVLSLFIQMGVTPARATGLEHVQGKFGLLYNWPIIPIAMMLMPDGRIFAYGTTPAGVQNAKLHYAIWDPSIGTDPSAFQTLPNTTDTDIFCAGQAIIPATGDALIVGGDALVNAKRNYANNDVNIFDPDTDTLTRQTRSMNFKRWYATAVTLPNGEHAVLGGRNDRFLAGATEATYSPIPEVRAANGNWRMLSSASSEQAYGAIGSSWYYPRAWVSPKGGLFLMAHTGNMYKLSTAGVGTLTKFTPKTSAGAANLPSVMFAPGRILSVRKNREAVIVDINNTGVGQPIVSPGGTLIKNRLYGSATVLADGKVWVNGGSTGGNTLTGAHFDSELWDPNTNSWTAAASASTARLYHSGSLLLPDGTVLSGGGGAPGPLTQRNGEIYYPPYLFKTDGSGELAPRPEIVDAPTTMIGWNQEFSIEATEAIGRVTLLRLGAATHNFDNEARFFNLTTSQTTNIVTVQSPATPNIAPPGFYMLFVWNTLGVPSVAKIIQIG